MANKIYSYQNFDFDVNNGSLDVLLWSIYAGIVIGVLASLIYRVCTHSFVDAVINAGAVDEDHAVTLDSLDFRGKKSGRGAYICHSLKCLRRARKGRRIDRVLECEIPESVYDAMEAELEQNEE